MVSYLEAFPAFIMSPVEENLLAHRVVRASRVRSWNVAFHWATPKFGFHVQDPFEGSLPLAFSGSVRSGFQEQHECIPLSATATETQGTDMHSPMMWPFPSISPFWTSTSHWSWVVQLLFHYYQPKLPGIFLTNWKNQRWPDPAIVLGVSPDADLTLAGFAPETMAAFLANGT